jgi:hypothetical protein
MNSRKISFLLCLGLLTGVGAVFYMFGDRTSSNITTTPDVASTADTTTSRHKPVEPAPLEFRNGSLDVAYVGDAKCAECHLEESENYRKHPMGRSMTTVTAHKTPAMTAPFTIDGYRYSIRTEGDRVVHVEERIDPSGEVLDRQEEPVSLLLGSGTRGHAYLVDREGELFQSPITWYSTAEKYDLSPGYHTKNMHFSRQIRQPCLHCHANQVEEKNDGAIRIQGLTIGCERCHGPGEMHLKEQKLAGGFDPTIVNPAKLTPSRRDQVCYQCHLQLDAREEVEGKSVVNFRPGGDLYEFVQRLEIPQSDPYQQLKSVGQPLQMEQSVCFQKSEGQMGCVTCHNPHDWPEKLEDRTTIYNKKCTNCHGVGSECSFPTPARLLKSPGDNCISCHMPTRQATDVGHTAMTDHRIPRTKPTTDVSVPGAPPVRP